MIHSVPARPPAVACETTVCAPGPGLRVADAGALAALRRRLVEHGVQVDEPPGEVPGVVRFFAFDPFGNRLELLAPA